MWMWIIVSAIGGMAIAAQALINWRLAAVAGNPFFAATISFGVGFAALLLVLLTQPGAMRQSTLGSAPWWVWIGGALGAFYIVMSILLIPRIGAAALLSAVVMGQLFFSLFADHFGFFGITPHPISLPRLAGAVLVVAGVVLVRLF